MNYKQYNDYELIYMVRENDDDSKSILYRKYEPIIRNISNDFYKKYSDYGYEYDDFLQEGMMGFQKALIYYDENKNVLFYSFVLLCVRRTLLTFCRNISMTKKNLSNYNPVDIDDIDLVDKGSNVSNILDYNEMIGLLKRKLLELPFEVSNVFELHLNGFSLREISILLDESVSTINSRFRKGKKILINSFREYCK